MGFSLTWIAVNGKHPSEILDVLELDRTGRHEEFPESPYTGARLAGGWYLVVEDHGDGRLARPETLARLSHSHTLVLGFVEEHVMFSAAACWSDGRQRWAVTHDAQKSPRDLSVEGEPPDGFDEIRSRLSEQQDDGVDYLFDVPVELARFVCGYRYDEDIPGAGERPFEVLEPRSRKTVARGFWERLFRRR